MTAKKKRYGFVQGRCGRCGTILTEKMAVIAKLGMRGDIPHGKCPGCKKLLPLVVEEEPEPQEGLGLEPEPEPVAEQPEATEPEPESEPEPISSEEEPEPEEESALRHYPVNE